MKALFAGILALSGCATAPAPDCPPPEVIAVPERVEIPVPVRREPPAALLSAIEPASVPSITEGAGDYCLTRDGMEALIDAANSLRERIARWEAWAVAGEGDDDH